GARDHVRPTVHVARVLREQLQRRLSGPRPADLPHEQLHRVPASGRPGDLDVDRGHVRIHEHDPGQALRIHEAHPADADDEIHRVPVEGPRIDEPRAHPDSRDDPGGGAVRRQLSARSDHVGRVVPRDLLPRPRDARRGNRCGESLPEGRVRADPHSRARALSDRLIPSRTRRCTKSVPTVNSRLRESWTEDTFGSVWRTWVFAVNSPRLSARQKRYFIGGPWVSWTRTASPMARRNSAKEAGPATTRW